MYINNQNLRIYRDGRLDKLATYKPLIIPAIIKYSQDGHLALSEALNTIKNVSIAINEQMNKVARS